jgi:hypothetical protein
MKNSFQRIVSVTSLKVSLAVSLVVATVPLSKANAEICEQLNSQLQSCRSSRDQQTSQERRARLELDELVRAYQNPDQSQIRECRRQFAQLQNSYREWEAAVLPLRTELNQSQVRRDRVQSEYQRTSQQMAYQWECVVSEKKFAESGVGVGRDQEQAINAAKANIRLDQIVAAQRSGADASQLQKIVNSVRRNSFYTFCYQAYRNDNDLLDRSKIEEGPQRALSGQRPNVPGPQIPRPVPNPGQPEPPTVDPIVLPPVNPPGPQIPRPVPGPRPRPVPGEPGVPTRPVGPRPPRPPRGEGSAESQQ